jgi:uracil-DNA glycosylase
VDELAEAPVTCRLCPRLAVFLDGVRQREPTWHNAPVRSFGPSTARLAIVGLAPGLKGANRTGRPFTGDFAGDLLYGTLLKFGFATGQFEARTDDSLQLVGCMVTNAVRCVPPENKPKPAEINTCRRFLSTRLAQLPNLTAVVVLGRIAHDSTLAALGVRKSLYPFKHGAHHRVERDGAVALSLFDSYHCSRYNTNTGVLTTSMFESVFANVRAQLGH